VTSLDIGSTLLRRLAKNVGSKAVNETVDWCPGKIQRSQESVGTSGLFQALLGQAAELPDPRFQ
jgi:predicted ester cyclase